MYDGMLNLQGEIVWPEESNAAKVLCFSSALYLKARHRNPRCAYFQYFPDPRTLPVALQDGRLRGLFWNRTASVNEGLIARLCEATVFEEFTLHDAPDPGSGAQSFSGQLIQTCRFHRHGWWRNRRDYLDVLARHNVFFAPRFYEGIGMGMIEAMAMGVCVVAPDRPTQNEYVVHGQNGILYDPLNPQPVNLNRALELGTSARQSVARGFEKWLAAEDELLNFISVPTPAFDAMLSRCFA